MPLTLISSARNLVMCSSIVIPVLADEIKTTTENSSLEFLHVYAGQLKDSYITKDSNSATRMDISVLETPQSISIINQAQMTDFNLTNSQSALSNVTGVYVEQVETDRTYYKSRGFDITNFQVDGVGQPFSSGNSHGEIDTAIYERIDVLRGANGLLTNSGNPSATINFIRKRPTENNQVLVTATAGSWDDYRVSTDASGSLSDSVRARAVVVKHDRDSYLREYSQDKTVVYGIVEIDLSENSLLTISHVTETSDADSPMWGALPLYYTDGTATDYDDSTSTSADWSYWNTRKHQSHIELTHNFNNGWLIKGSYTHITTDEDSELFYVYGTPAPITEAGLNGWASEYDFDDQQRIAEIYATGQYHLFNREHDLVAGINWSDSHYVDKSLYDYSTGNGFPTIPNLNTWKGNTPRPTFADGATGSDVNTVQQSAYTATRFHISDSLSALLGAKLSTIEVKGASYDVDQSSRHSDEVTPYAGIIYKLQDNISLYTSYSEIFTPQQEVDINRKPLGAVDGESKEVGIKGEFLNGKLMATMAWFEVEQNNLAVAAGTIPNSVDTYYRGSDGIESKGYDLEIVGEITEGLQASLGLTQLSIDGDDTVEDYTPETLFRLSTSYRIPSLSAMKVGMSYNWQEKTSRDQGNGITTKQDSYGIVNAFVNYQLTDNISVSLNGNNLSDEKYLSSLYWGQAYYQAPRNYSASISWQL